MGMTAFVRQLLAGLGLVAFAAWLPIAAITWVPGWHAASCDWHARCDDYGRSSALQHIDELRAFMQGRGDLSTGYWSEKEVLHLSEVRTMLVQFSVLAFLGALLYAHSEARVRARVARIAMLAVAACVIVLPFFGTFWRDIFHPLLFDNDLWRNNPGDTSWWIMPRIYFQYSTALVVGVATLVCALAKLQAQSTLDRAENRH